MQEVDGRIAAGHVIVDRDHVQSVRAERLQHRCDFVRKHRHVACDFSACVTAVERRPSVQAHARVDGRAHFFQVYIVATDGDLINRSGLFAIVPHDSSNFRGVDLSGRNVASAAAHRGLVLRRSTTDQIDGGFGVFGQIRSLAVSVDMHVENSRTLVEEVVMQSRHFEPIRE